MLSEVLQKESLYLLLYLIDKDIAKQSRTKKCQFCGHDLHYANYDRKPRGEPDGIPKKHFIRFSLCCGQEGCRKRYIPPSSRFLGRKVY